MIAMMVQHHALTKMVFVMMHDFCRGNGIPKSNYCLSFFLKSSEQKSKVQIFGCCNQNSQQDKVQHQERIDRSLYGELKDLMIIIKV
jgi:hypothetical protein